MTNRTQFRLAAEYESSPTWQRDADNVWKNTSPEVLPLPSSFVGDLLRWAAIFDETLNHSDPLSSGFASEREHELFVQWGKSLAQMMAELLQQDIEYCDDLTNETVQVSQFGFSQG